MDDAVPARTSLAEREADGWPALPVADWQDTRDTLHLWTQIVGKLRLALSPPVNHWWHVPLYVDARGLTTSLMPAGQRGLEVVFDFGAHELLMQRTDGAGRRMALEPRSVADFHAEFRAHLAELEVDARITRMPVEIATASPFDVDDVDTSYDPDAVHRFWTSLVSAHRVLSRFRGQFRGKASPVHFFGAPSTSPSAGSPAVRRPYIPAASRTARTG